MKKFGDIYEFVYVNFYIKKKKFASGMGFQPGTNIRTWNRRALPSTTPPPSSVAILFIYHTIGNKNTIRKTRHVQIHTCDI